jgi:3-hydroxyacyl-CoA dehydrogenase/enoyl-CoA hydratase/3-hydroxybutyryl-CoA epimerase
MPLVEVATPPGVSTAHVQRLHALLRAQGKRWVKVSDTPGFLITRVLLGYWSETVEVVAEGVSPADVDGRLEAQGWPMGPCRVMDGTTLASVVRISGPLVGVLDGRIAGVRRLAPVVAAGYVGGQHDGFYRRTTPGAPTPNEPALALLREHRHPAAAPADVVDRIVGAMLNEAAYCIADGVVTSWSDVAYAIDNAFGFPAAVGGLLGYLDAVTPDGLADRLDAWSDRHGRRFTPCPVFRHRAITPVEVHS